MHLAGVALGMVATLVLVAGRVAVPAWRLAGQRPHWPDATGPAGAGSTLADRAARPACRPARWAGCAWRWSRAGPAGGAGAHSLVGITAGIVAFTAAVTFAASLDRLLGTLDCTAGTSTPSPGLAAGRPATAARRGWRPTRTWAPTRPCGSPRSGSTAPWSARPAGHGRRLRSTLVEGREPSGPDEVVLGAATLRRLGLRLGQTVRVEAGRPAAMRVVGRSALVNIDSEAGDGAILTIEGLRRLEPARGSGYGVFYVRYAPGPIPGRRSEEPAAAAVRAGPGDRPPRPPSNVENLGRVGDLPNVLAGLLALLPPPSPTCW